MNLDRSLKEKAEIAVKKSFGEYALLIDAHKRKEDSIKILSTYKKYIGTKNEFDEFAIHSLVSNGAKEFLENGYYFQDENTAKSFFNIMSNRENTIKLAETGTIYKVIHSFGDLVILSQELNNENDEPNEFSWSKVEELDKFVADSINRKFCTDFVPNVIYAEDEQKLDEMPFLTLYNLRAYSIVMDLKNTMSNSDIESNSQIKDFISKINEHLALPHMEDMHFNDIDYLKDVTVSLRDVLGSNCSNLINDMIFSIETAYQNYYDLDKDNWDKIEPKLSDTQVIENNQESITQNQ